MINPKINFDTEKNSDGRDGVIRPIWKYSDEELNDFQVTPLSKYNDRKWMRPVIVPGMIQTHSSVNWGMTLLDDSKLTDSQHTIRLQWARKLLAALLHAPSSGVVPAEGSTSSFQHSFKWLLSWMAENGYQHLSEFTPDVFEQYIKDLPRYICEQQDEDEIGQGTVRFALSILAFAWTERRILTKWGVQTLNYNPFFKKGIQAYIDEISTKARGWLQPLPDEVAVPLFNRASQFMGEMSEDILQLRDALFRAQDSGFGYGKIQDLQNEFLANFTFRVLPRGTEQWHLPLNGSYEEVSGVSPLFRVRQLIEGLRTACAILIQGTAGMRISELMGIQAGFDLTSGLPKGVRIEGTATGLYDLFLLRTVLSKTEKGLPREVDWVLGLRPKGVVEEPLAVRALRLLNRLYEPWHEYAKTPRLFLALVSGYLPRKSTKLNVMNSSSLCRCMKKFMERWVDLSDLHNESVHKVADNDLVKWRESKGTIISSHMLRKSWAQFVFAVNPKLMPAIQLQFHHLSIAMTDSGYIGNNPLLVTAMNSVATQQRNLLIYETVLGRQPLAGKMGEQIEVATRELATQVKGLPTSSAWQRTVQFCDDIDLKIFFNPHGKCVPLSTSKMRCHNEVGTPLGLRAQPNASSRQPSLCAGCDCFVLDTRHAAFWEARYFQNSISLRRAESMGVADKFRAIKDRAVQAGKLLKKIGVNIEKIDARVNLALKEDDVIA